MYRKYTTIKKYRQKDYDRLCYLEKKHKLGIKFTRSEIREFISLSWKKWKKTMN